MFSTSNDTLHHKFSTPFWILSKRCNVLESCNNVLSVVVFSQFVTDVWVNEIPEFLIQFRYLNLPDRISKFAQWLGILGSFGDTNFQNQLMGKFYPFSYQKGYCSVTQTFWVTIQCKMSSYTLSSAALFLNPSNKKRTDGFIICWN